MSLAEVVGDVGPATLSAPSVGEGLGPPGEAAPS